MFHLECVFVGVQKSLVLKASSRQQALDLEKLIAAEMAMQELARAEEQAMQAMKDAFELEQLCLQIQSTGVPSAVPPPPVGSVAAPTGPRHKSTVSTLPSRAIASSSSAEPVPVRRAKTGAATAKSNKSQQAAVSFPSSSARIPSKATNTKLDQKRW